jgi:hypothetical protein
MAPRLFVKSTDGGKSWTSRSMTPLVNGLVDVSFLNEREGFAVGALGDGTTQAAEDAAQTVILATTDGGETWQVRYTSPTIGQRAWKIQFASDQIGYVTTEGTHAEGVVLKTTDGGATWVPMLVSSGQPLEAVAFVDPEPWVGGEPRHDLLHGGRRRHVEDPLFWNAPQPDACGERFARLWLWGPRVPVETQLGGIGLCVRVDASADLEAPRSACARRNGCGGVLWGVRRLRRTGVALSTHGVRRSC